MKKILYTTIGLPISLLTLIACSGNSGEGNIKDTENGQNISAVTAMEDNKANSESQNTQSGNSMGESMTETMTETDGNTGATFPAESGTNGISDNGNGSSSHYKKTTTFNGIITTPPRSHSTITLTMGGAIENIYVFPGDMVKKGQTIATLKNPEFIQLQQEFLTATAQVEYLEKEYNRQQNLASHEAASQKKLQQSKAEFLSEKSRLDAAKAQLTLLNVDTETLKEKGLKTYLEIKAPISGYVTDLQANLGQYFDAGQPICDIINKSEALLQLTAYEKDLAYISVGNKVTFTVNGLENKTFHAEIIAIDQMVNSENRSINVYAKVKSTDKLFRQGMYVSAKIDGNM